MFGIIALLFSKLAEKIYILLTIFLVLLSEINLYTNYYFVESSKHDWIEWLPMRLWIIGIILYLYQQFLYTFRDKAIISKEVFKTSETLSLLYPGAHIVLSAFFIVLRLIFHNY